MNEKRRKTYYKRSGNHEMCKELFQQASDEIALTGGKWNVHQQEALLNHLAEMVRRTVEGEKITPVDKSLFHEISQESFSASEKIVTRLDDIPEDEIYLLAIHFEVINQK